MQSIHVLIYIYIFFSSLFIIISFVWSCLCDFLPVFLSNDNDNVNNFVLCNLAYNYWNNFTSVASRSGGFKCEMLSPKLYHHYNYSNKKKNKTF